MKIAYVSIHSSADPNTWSGLNKSIADCLRLQGLEVVLVGPLYNSRRAFFSKVLTKARELFSKKRFLWTREHSLLRAYGRDLEKQLAKLDCDVIFSPGTEAIAYLSENIHTPVVFWTDSPFGPLVNYYAWYTNLASPCVCEAMESDTRALRRSTLACYSSNWAAEAAINLHHANREKVVVLPFGPNLDFGVAESEIADLALRRLQAPWRFLFVGVDWVRKGGDRAMQIVAELNRLGFPSELDVVGCTPPSSVGEATFVKLHGFISRRDDAGCRKLETLYRQSTFFILPSVAEAFGVVFCEAAAHALPILATNTGGIPTAVRDGITGHLFETDATVADYIEKILKCTKALPYEAMARAAYDDSKTRLNWQASGSRLKALMETALHLNRSLQTAN